MTHAPRADELLRVDLEWLEALGHDSWRCTWTQPDGTPVYGCVCGKDEHVANLRDYLAEPHGEAEYVWRVTHIPTGEHLVPTREYGPLVEALMRAQDETYRIERAQVGPWERVDG